MTIKDIISNDLKTAMRARDKKTLDALRLISASIKQIEVDERIDVDDQRMLLLLDKLAKQRNESITQFRAAHREDLVAQEQFELDIIKKYLPEPLDEKSIQLIIEQALGETGAQCLGDMSKVMAKIKPMVQGRADMSKVSSIIKEKLS
ncbi:MAG: GatB/YqeY domain-containing protein [Legionella sp.]